MSLPTGDAVAPYGRLPLFYRDPQPLSATQHAGWRLGDGDFSFAEEAPYVPIVIGELGSASRSYPVVFAAGDATPLAILGLDRANLFAANGHWADDAYVPAYVRRYPFGFIATTEPDGFVLALDSGSPRVLRSGDDGIALFEDGKPSAFTRQALQFCDSFRVEAQATEAFAAALKEQDLLIERRADVTLPDGRKLGVHGFQIIDVERFATLDDATVLAWHRNGWLALVHFHLASLERFPALLARQAAHGGSHQPETDSGQAATALPLEPTKA